MALIVSHTTARELHQTLDASTAEHLGTRLNPCPRSTLPKTAPSSKELAYARRRLRALGVDEASLREIDLLVPSPACMHRLKGAKFHFLTLPLPFGCLMSLAPDIFVVDPRLCAVQAATELPFIELVEYCYRLCQGSVTYFESRGDGFSAHMISRQILRVFLEAMPGAAGVKQMRRALTYTRDRARSPMEIALALLVVLPKKLGGLGIRCAELDRKVPVTGEARRFTRRRSLVFDIYIPKLLLDIEYDGSQHNDPVQRAIDEERAAALRAMGYHLINFSSASLFDPLAFQRKMRIIMRMQGVSESDLPAGFSARQEELRKFALRNSSRS